MALAVSFHKMESTRKRLELTKIMVEIFEQTPHDLISKIVYMLQGKIRPEYEGVELGIAEKLAIKALSKSSGVPIKKIEQAYQKEGDLGLAAETIMNQKMQTTFMVQDITVERVYETLLKIARLGGHRSQDLKMRYISSLLNDASSTESTYILKILLGTLRLGVAENTMMDALAIAFTGEKSNKAIIERAYNVSSDLGKVAEVVATGGLDGISSFKTELFSPIRPMLAERVKSGVEAITKMGGKHAAEYKLDGERVQIHIKSNEVAMYSRKLENISSYYPDIAEKIPGAIQADNAILEAEAVAINENTGEFLPFQELMHRRRKYGVEKAVMQYPIAVNFFDILYKNNQSCMELKYEDRRKILEDTIKEDGFARLVVMNIINEASEIEEFMEDGINAGSEGLMLKMLDKPYQAGARGNYWLKLKKEYRNDLGDSLDLVVVGGFFGKGKRTGMYGTLLLASYNEDTDTFASVCKVGTGFTDDNLDRLYQMLHPRVTIKRNPRIDSNMVADVWFEPELVVEIVASEITQSPIHKTAWNIIKKEAGLALRFPKFTGRIREEKSAEDASTIEEIINLYRGQKKVTQRINSEHRS